MSPARLERLLACPLRIAFEQTRPTGDRTVTSPPALVGLAVHRTIELCLGDPAIDLPAAWHQACGELAETIADPRTAPSARRALLRLQRRLPDLLAFIETCHPSELLVEHSLAAPDGSITGRLDLLILGEHPCVIDYKTGLVTSEYGPRPGYERQLIVYAWLVERALGVDVNTGALFSLRQGIVEIDVSSKARSRLMSDARAAVEAFNVRAPGPQPATPSEPACGWCPFVGSCDDAWNALQRGDLERFGWGEAARGSVRAPIVVSGSGLAAVPLDITGGTVVGTGTLIDVPAAIATGLVVGDPVAVWAVAKRSDEPLTLAWRDDRSAIATAAL